MRAVGVDDAALSRPAVGGQEMRRDAVEHGAERGVARLAELGQPLNLADEQLVALVRDGTVVEEPLEASRRSRRARRASRSADSRHTRSGREVGRSLGEEPIERRPRHQPPLEQRRQPLARPRDAELREHERDVRIGPRLARQDAQRVVERILDEARNLGLVRQVEAGIEIGFERKLPQQRQAERVDRADRDVAEAVAQIEPAGSIELASARRPSPSSRRIRSRISAAALRVNVIARMFAGSTPRLSRLT